MEKALVWISGGAPAYVFGIADADRGQTVVAVIATEDDVDEAALRKALRRELSAYKVPRRIVAVITKGTRVGLIMPNGVGWVRTALALTRIGAVLVPLSTLLAPRELVAQLRVASVQYLVSVEEFRGHRYLDELKTECRAPRESC